MNTNTASSYRDMLDIIFEHKNKAYGAYYLRRTYKDRITRAILFVIGGLIALVVIPIILRAVTPAKEVEKTEEVIAELLPPPPLDPNEPPPPPPPPVETPPPTRPTVQFVPPTLKEDKDVVEETPPPKEEEFKEAEAATKTQEGDPNAQVVVEDPGIGEVKKEIIETPPPPKQEVFEFVEQMPEFPGGQLELMKFLASQIRYPDIAREGGIEGTVALTFVVDEHGKINDVQVIRDIGGGCGQEAIRVVRMMPAWKPGKQNGNAVKVKYKLPVKFKLN